MKQRAGSLEVLTELTTFSRMTNKRYCRITNTSSETGWGGCGQMEWVGVAGGE